MAPAFDPSVEPPSSLFLSLSTSDICNYRCRHCHIWMQSAVPDALPISRRVELVHEFARLNPQGTVVVPGGEVTLNLDELLSVAGACRDEGLPCIIMTNGSMVDSPAVADSIVGSGVTLVSVSLDSHLPEIHNYVRGVATAFDEATRAVRLLAAARDSHPGPFLLIVTAVLFKENLGLFAEFADYCRSLGADRVDFQMLARTFANAHRTRDSFFEKHFWHSPGEKEEARRLARSIFESAAAKEGLLVKKPHELDWVLDYIGDPDFRTREPVCGSHHQNIMIDARGDAALCFNTRRILDEPFVGNARTSSLLSLWSGSKAAADRSVMDRCRLNCGALNCHRKEGD